MGWSIALHGGAGVVPVNLPPELVQRRDESLAGLHHCLNVGVTALNHGRSALDVVELVVRELENHPRFNAGRGSVLNCEGTVEMEASIMDGNTKNCGAVSGLKTVANPISLARLVMEKTSHVYLGFDGAEAFAREQGVETLKPVDFITQENVQRLILAKEANMVQQLDYTPAEHKEVLRETHAANEVDVGSNLGTVGCVAVDNKGNLASATSTGGLVNKMVGRIGDTPIIGSGTYANSYCAVSATGVGEHIIRGTIAREVAALMEYKGMSLKEAASYAVENCAPRDSMGLVAVSAKGEIAMPFNTIGMYRACATQDGYSDVAIH